jgi:glucosamine-6-phosphate deaminase
MEAVPRQAISMSVPQIMKAECILCIVPEKRKAKAVLECFGGPVSNMHPASILQQHSDALVLLDKESASLLGG